MYAHDPAAGDRHASALARPTGTARAGHPTRCRDAYKTFLETHSLEQIGADDDFAAAARDRTAGRKVSF